MASIIVFGFKNALDFAFFVDNEEEENQKTN